MNLNSFIWKKFFAYLLTEVPEEKKNPDTKSLPYPPWLQDMQLCNTCGLCIESCPQHILILEQGQPRVDFCLGACSFCGACAKSCPTGALHFDSNQPAWTHRASLASHCLCRRQVFCQSCQDACAVGAIRIPLLLAQGPEIVAEQCNGCGACAAICPVGAITFTQPQKSQQEDI